MPSNITASFNSLYNNEPIIPMVMASHLIWAKVEFQTRFNNFVSRWLWQITNLEHIKQQNIVLHRKMYFYSFSQELF